MIKDQYREETNKDVYSDSSQGSYEDDYVRWLETKLQLLQPDVIKSLPTDEKIQEWGEDYADEHFERSDNPLSKWWLEAETFTNGGRAVIRHIEGNVL